MYCKLPMSFFAAPGGPSRGLRLLLLACALVGALTSTAHAQPPLDPRAASQHTLTLSAPTDSPYLTTRWTTEEGLPQNSITSIVQTRDGYLWMGTFGGLVRFDGLRFTTLNTGNTPQLKSNRITALMEDRDGALWIGSETGEVTRYLGGEFTTYTAADGFFNEPVMSFYQDRAGTIWAPTLSYNLVRFESNQPTKVEVLTTKKGLPERVFSVGEDDEGNLLVGMRWGLMTYRDGAFSEYLKIEGLPKDAVLLMRPHPDGGLWLVTGTSLGRLAGQRFTPYLNFSERMALPGLDLAQNGAHEVWFGYWGKVLYHGNKEGVFTAEDPTRLSSYRVRSMLADNEGNFWIGTAGNGLIRLRKRRVATLSTADGLSNDEIMLITETNEGDAWVGVFGAVNRLSGGKLTSWSGPEWLKSMNDSAAHSFYQDRAGNFWIGGDKCIARFRDEKFEVHQLERGDLSVDAILEDRKGQLWLGTSSGLAMYRDGVITKLYEPRDGLVHKEIKFLMEDRAGALWLGTTGGLSRFHEGGFTNYTTASGLSNDNVRAVYEDQDGVVWIGTYGGGLNRLKDGRIKHITMKDGLFDDIVSRIMVDERDRFWMLGNRGIYYVSRQQLNDVAEGRSRSVTCGSYGVADGMITSEGNGGRQPAGWRMRDGRMWFPTIKGVAIVDPNQPDAPPPPVVIEQVSLDREPVDFRREVRVTPDRENLEIQYTGLNFSKPEQVRFRYKLEGLDEDWVDAGTRRAAYYSHPPPGTYTFRVLAANSDGVWSTECASIRVVVRPPFYRTRWFIGLALAALAGLAFVGYRWRVQELKRDRAEQEEFSRRLLATQEEERRRLAIELHDGLGQSLVIIKNRALLSLSRPEDHERALTQLEEISEATTSALDEIRELARSLHPYQLDRLGLAYALDSMIERVADSSEIKFEREIDAVDGVLSKEAQINLYRIVQESLNNVVKHSGASEVKVILKKDAGALRLSVRDNGRGFDASTAPSGKQGLGLTGIAERAKVLGAKPEIHSAPGQGTTLMLNIGLKRPENAK
jgi:signal transduction histidine kinase/ligand-binding sensor domain-containing protein